MFEEFEDYYDTSSLEEALKKFTTSLKKATTKTLSDQIKDLKEKQRRLEMKQRELNIKENDLKEHKSNIIAEFLKGCGLDLDIGQKVYVIKRYVDNSPCDLCNGTGRVCGIIKGEDIEVECPKCEGNGKQQHEHYAIEEKYVVRLVTEIYVDKDNWSKNYNLSIQDEDGNFIKPRAIVLGTSPDKEDYCGSHYSRDSVYLTLEEAEEVEQKLKEKENDMMTEQSYFDY